MSTKLSKTDKPAIGYEPVLATGRDKELACWIYYEEGHTYYCYECVDKRVNEINANKEFAEDINYEDGDDCGYYQDYADNEVECCKCGKPLFSKVDC